MEITPSQPKRISCLDGLRALSIVLVLMGHSIRVAYPGAPTQTWIAILEAGAQLGVHIFFCISGFLITTLLLHEERATGGLNLKGFYWRRAFRILPPLYVYLLAMKLASAWTMPLANRDLFSALVFMRDYLQRPEGWVVAHTWSLGVEEKFYLFYPLLLVLARQWALTVTLLLIPTVALLRGLTPYYWPENTPLLDFQFHTLADVILWGCAAALLVQRGLPEWATKVGQSQSFQATVFVTLFILSPWLAARVGHENYYHTLGLCWDGVLSAILVLAVSQFPETAVGKALEWAPLVYVGVLSYSLYIWQQPFMDSRIWHYGFPLNLVAAWACAELSYRLVERPSLRWRKRLTVAAVVRH